MPSLYHINKLYALKTLAVLDYSKPTGTRHNLLSIFTVKALIYVINPLINRVSCDF